MPLPEACGVKQLLDNPVCQMEGDSYLILCARYLERSRMLEGHNYDPMGASLRDMYLAARQSAPLTWSCYGSH